MNLIQFSMNFPIQVSSDRRSASDLSAGSFDPRNSLLPRRMTLAMWDQAYLLRHGEGGAFADWDRVLDETIERGYNTVRIDPMPQWIDLSMPDQVLHWEDPRQPFMPWCWNGPVSASAGRWLIEFMEKLRSRQQLYYTLSAWWFMTEGTPAVLRKPETLSDGAEMWCQMLTQWKSRFGFDHLVYVDLANELPYFFPDFVPRLQRETGSDWGGVFDSQVIGFLTHEINSAMKLLQSEFPELRFTCSIHGDLRWLDVPVEFDCLDVHFYADADSRWISRTKFGQYGDMFQSTAWHAEFSDRATKTAAAIAPMLRSRQRAKLAQFAAWASHRGMPLTTSESWASWYMFDAPEMDWGWLLDWAEWSVEDAIEFGMWGWTPHNYVAPQFKNWDDVRWHQRLTERFLRS